MIERDHRGDQRKQTGNMGEQLAKSYLMEHGYEIIEQNWRCRVGEIDLIALKDHMLVFVEVRTRKSERQFGSALESVTPRKQHKIRTLAQIYLQMNQLHDRAICFDIITVLLRSDLTIKHLDHISHAF